MNKQLYISLLFLLFAAQIFVPAHMIYQQEDAINTGTAYKFKTEPFDPSDPFRGKYVTLNYEIESFQTEEENWPYKADIYVYLEKDKQGFAAVKTISKTSLNSDDDYVMAKIYSAYGGNLNFEFPFNRFYMNENKAYDAEVSVRKAQRDTTLSCYALVYVKNGAAVLNNVFIDDIPIKQFVEEYQELVE